MALSYFHSVQAVGVTYSVDMLTLRGSFQPEVLDVDFVFPKKIAFLDAFCARMRAFCISNEYDYEYFESFKFLTYRDAQGSTGQATDQKRPQRNQRTTAHQKHK